MVILGLTRSASWSHCMEKPLSLQALLPVSVKQRLACSRSKEATCSSRDAAQSGFGKWLDQSKPPAEKEASEPSICTTTTSCKPSSPRPPGRLDDSTS